MKQLRFSNYIEGRESGAELPLLNVPTLDKDLELIVPDSDLTTVMALRSAVTSLGDSPNDIRSNNGLRSLDSRISVVRDLYKDFREQQDEVVNFTHCVHGTSKRYLTDSLRDLEQWVDKLETFIENVDEFSLMNDGICFAERAILSPYFIVTAGNFEAYESFFLIAQTILAGTHLIIRPSAYDLATHIIFNIISRKELADLGQKLTWDSATHPDLIKHLVRFAPGVSIFGSSDQIRSMLKTNIREQYPDGHLQERTIEDLSEGRKTKAYGSGNSLLVVMGEPEQAADHFHYAKVLAKGNKCWVPDGAIVLDKYEQAFCEKLIELDSRHKSDRPKLREEEIKNIDYYLSQKMGRMPDFSKRESDSNSIGIMIYRNLKPDSPYFDQEITFPAAGIVSVESIEDAISSLKHIGRRRNIDRFLSIGYFGDEEGFKLIRRYIASEAYHDNESLKVDLMQPHQGSYFMIDPTVKSAN